jgi:hypothetical protein
VRKWFGCKFFNFGYRLRKFSNLQLFLGAKKSPLAAG